MAVQSKLAPGQNKPMTGIKAFNNLIGSQLMKAKIYQMVGSTDAQEFITSITSAVNTNPQLAECDAQSIISAALLGQPFMCVDTFAQYLVVKNDSIVLKVLPGIFCPYLS